MADTQRSTALGAAASLVALLLAAPTPATALAHLTGTRASGDPTEPLVAAVALAAWAVTAWLALTVVVVLLSRVPGGIGRSGAAVARHVAPAAVRRVVEAALGITVAVGALAPSAAVADPLGGPARPLGAAAADAGWDLDWPSLGDPATPVPAPAVTHAPASPPSPGPATPTRAPSASAAPTSTATAAAGPPAGPVTTPPAAHTPSARRASVLPRSGPAAVTAPGVRPSPQAPAHGTVVVRPGDSLWALAEASLRRAGTAAPTDRAVAQAWPQWWSANRAVIGDDPDLLLPGTVLRPPTGSAGPH